MRKKNEEENGIRSRRMGRINRRKKKGRIKNELINIHIKQNKKKKKKMKKKM